MGIEIGLVKKHVKNFLLYRKFFIVLYKKKYCRLIIRKKVNWKKVSYIIYFIKIGFFLQKTVLCEKLTFPKKKNMCQVKIFLVFLFTKALFSKMNKPPILSLFCILCCRLFSLILSFFLHIICYIFATLIIS